MATVYQDGFLAIGQSNQEPTATLNDYLALVPEFNIAALTLTPSISIYYGTAIESIRYLTFYNPETAPGTLPGGAAPAPFAAYTYDYYAKFLPWSPIEGDAGLGRPNPSPVGFRYPNEFSRPLGPLLNVPAAQPLAAYAALVGSSLDLARRLHGHWKKRVNVVKCAVGSTQLASTEAAMPGFYYDWGWFSAKTHTNWSPGGLRNLFARLRVTLVSAKVASDAESTPLRLRFVSIHLSESDTAYANARSMFSVNAPAFVEEIRKVIYDNSLTDTAPEQIIVIWPKIPDVPWGSTNAAAINTVLDSMMRDDPYFVTYDTNDSKFAKIAGDPPHFSAVGIMSIAEADFAAYQAADIRARASFPDANTITLSEMRTLVLREVERNSDDSALAADVVTEAINNAYHDLIRQCGDTTWWLRQMTTFSLSCSPWAAVDLPRVVTRLLEIRPVSSPLSTINFSMIGHSDRGRVRITTLDVVNQPVVLHHVYDPINLVGDGQVLFLPAAYVEAVKIGAAWRIAKAVKDVALSATLYGEAKRLKDEVCMHAQKVDRQRRQLLTGGMRRHRYTSQTVDQFTSRYPWQ